MNVKSLQHIYDFLGPQDWSVVTKLIKQAGAFAWTDKEMDKIFRGMNDRIGEPYVEDIVADVLHKKLLSLLDSGEVSTAMSSQTIDPIVKKHAQLIGTIVSDVSTRGTYSDQEVVDIILGNGKNTDDIKFAYSLAEYVKAENAPLSVLRAALDSLLEDYTKPHTKTVNWADTFFFVLIMFLVWTNFRSLTEKEQEFLVQNYLYHAVVCGVPLRQIMHEWVGGSRDLIQFAKRFQLLQTWWSGSKEEIVRVKKRTCKN